MGFYDNFQLIRAKNADNKHVSLKGEVSETVVTPLCHLSISEAFTTSCSPAWLCSDVLLQQVATR